MNESDFHELAGRLEGTVRALMLLATNLEIAGTLVGKQYSTDLREIAAALRFDGEHLFPAQRTMNEMANAMDAARERRKSQQRAESQTYRR